MSASSSVAWQLGTHRPAAEAGRSSAELAAEVLDAFAQAPQAASGAGQSGIARGAGVVLDAHRQAAFAVVDPDDDADVGARRVPQCVGQTLLHDAEGDVRHRRRHAVAVALEAAADVEPA